MNHPTLTYSIELPQKVEQILENDWWVYTHLRAAALRPVKEAIKFTSFVSVFVSSGAADVEVNLLHVRVKAPCIVHIKPDQVLQLKHITDDFTASFIVLNEHSRDALLLALHDAGALVSTRLDPVVRVVPADVQAFTDFYERLESLQREAGNPYRTKAFHHMVLAFFFGVAYRCYRKCDTPDADTSSFRGNPLVDRFLVLVQQYFKEQRQIRYYASRLGVTSKHLSRILKKNTGFTANDWVKNYVVLEAKVMLKSSTLTMGQISAQLNFPSQSFFAKFFKNATGLTPKQFRNSPADTATPFRPSNNIENPAGVSV